MKFKTVSRILLTGLLASSLLVGCTKTEETSPAPTTQEETSTEMAVAQTEEVEKALQDTSSLVIDTRVNDAYNGWALDGVKRGGHLPNAIDFSATWIDSEYDDKNNLEERSRQEVLDLAIQEKAITPDKNIILYDTNGKDAQKVAQFLQKKGISNIKTYDANDWINSEKELVSYKNYELLVAPSVVKDLIDGKPAPSFENAKNIKIFDIRWGTTPESGYLDGHVPGAVHINTDSFEPPVEDAEGNTNWLLASPDILEKLLLDNGITSEDTVICTSPEPMAASRFAIICQYMGVKDVRVMNGGLVLWKALGYDLAKDEAKPSPVTNFGVKTPANPSLVQSMKEVQEILDNEEKAKDFVLVDNRTWEEYIGESSGYSYHNKKGRIPGAVFGHAGVKNSSSMCFYRNIDKTMRNEGEIQELWSSDNIDTSKHLSFMCGSGWRAAEVLWYSKVMGMDNTSLYSDGWIGWSNSHLPNESGDPTK